jgi:hypothetical protein
VQEGGGAMTEHDERLTCLSFVPAPDKAYTVEVPKMPKVQEGGATMTDINASEVSQYIHEQIKVLKAMSGTECVSIGVEEHEEHEGALVVFVRVGDNKCTEAFPADRSAYPALRECVESMKQLYAVKCTESISRMIRDGNHLFRVLQVHDEVYERMPDEFKGKCFGLAWPEVIPMSFSAEGG